MRKLARSPGYLRGKRLLGYVYVVAGIVIAGQIVSRAHGFAEMVPGLLLGGAFVALGIVRLRSFPA